MTVSDQDFLDIGSGKLNPQKVEHLLERVILKSVRYIGMDSTGQAIFNFQAFMSGKLKVKGNVMLLQKLQGLLDSKKKSKL